tara:strand:+ start:1814 stop:2557 length:744 start_codon:yes stop_codon:yes gene_type:complete
MITSKNIPSYVKNAKIEIPMGPIIYGNAVPEKIFSKIEKLAEDTWNRPDRLDWADELVGHMKHQYYIPHDVLKEYGIYDFLIQSCWWYVFTVEYNQDESEDSENYNQRQKGFNLKNLVIDLEAVWINYQEQGEYNPTHNHGQSNISGVIHIKDAVKGDSGRKNMKDSTLTLFGGHSPIGMYDRSTMTVPCVPRQFLMWPSQMLHQVNPFFGEGQRISMAFNYVSWYKHNQGNYHTPKSYSDGPAQTD